MPFDLFSESGTFSAVEGDSIYVKPFIPHNFREKGKLLILRIGSRITGDAQREFSNLDKNDAERAIQETQMWFDPKGK